MTSPGHFPADIPIAPEMLVPRIGETMLERGILTRESLQKALAYQRSRSTGGRPILLGQALLELGLVNRETLDEVITFQIFQLQNALNETNRQLEQRVQERTQDLQRALERLSELNQLKANFISNISHELRTPLTHLKGYLDLLIGQGLGPLNDQQVHALDILQRAEERLESLIENLIQFSLLSRGELQLALEPLDLNDLIFESAGRSEWKAEAKRISLRVDLQPDLPPVRGDREKLGWVIGQLLDNAIKFTTEAGQVSISSRHEEGIATVLVEDQGIGIPEDHLEEIFEAFHQLDGSATRRYGGTGLGLAMVRRIVEAHGSKVEVDSVVNQGSRFSFALPITGGQPVRFAPEAEQRIMEDA